MIRKVYEVDPMVCPKCEGTIKIIVFITQFRAVDRIIDHLKSTFVAAKLPPFHALAEVALMAAERELFLIISFLRGAGVYGLSAGAVGLLAQRTSFRPPRGFLDSVARLAVVFHHDQEGIFIAPQKKENPIIHWL
ncbi:MAG: hypothetical protein WAU81_07525 [Candidatus Aminicenantales bacterium]